MERGPVWRVLLALSLLDMSSGGPGGSGGSGWVYEVHMEEVNFDKAVEGCSGGGALAELPTQQDVSEVLLRLEDGLRGSAGPQAFWVGLRKTKDKCVIPRLLLRGFSWRSDGGEQWAGPVRWWEEPEETCISRCAALKAQTDGSGPVGARWGLLARPCGNRLPFICKRTHGHKDPPLTTPAPVRTEPPTTRTLVVTTTATATSTLTPTTLTPTLTPGPGPGPVSDTKPEPKPKPEAEPGAEQDPKPESKPEPGPGPSPTKVPASRPCHIPSLPWARWLRPDPEDPVVLTLECWSGAQLQIHCSDGRWEYLGAALDPAVVCPESRSTAPPPPPPPPPPPSPSEASQVEVQEGPWAGLLVPVLVAVAVLVVLVVLVVVLVWYCLSRRSKDRAVRKAEKMAMENKEAGGKDSMETTNEKGRR